MLDSRNKIVNWQCARELDARMVTGYFDPMIPAHVERLRALAGEGSLVVLLKTPREAFLDPRARAELAASLAFVCAVVVDEAEWQGADAFPAHEEEAPLREEFLAMVREKSSVKA